jgi:PrcB C-terminal
MKVASCLIPPLVFTALSLGCLDAASPGRGGPAFGARVSLDSLVPVTHEYYSGLADPARLVISDAATWAVIWAQLNAGLQPRPSLPAVDFRTQQVLLVALGQRTTGGYDIRVDSVVLFALGSVAYVSATAPGRNCLTTQALTQTVDLVRLAPPPVTPIAFEERAVVRDCS